jgi:uncharacterized protein YdhG (YjbR/CyaY superfamily)
VPPTVDDYIQAFPEDVRAVLERIRAAIHEVIPGAGEKISYGIPTITVDDKALIYFAGWKNHISVYPVPSAGGPVATELGPYVTAKGTLKFPLKQPIPIPLVQRVAQQLLADRAGS